MDNQDDTTPEAESQIIEEIRRLAGTLGHDCDERLDSEAYAAQVETGLAQAVVEILDKSPEGLVHWFGHCLIQYSFWGESETKQARIMALLDALGNEAQNQAEEHGPDEETEA
jgi:hypothetical protein